MDDHKCQAITRDMWFRKHKGERCEFGARVLIDGRKLCNRHASTLALKLMLRDGLASRIEQPDFVEPRKEYIDT